jgi:hypothetical protein
MGITERQKLFFTLARREFDSDRRLLFSRTPTLRTIAWNTTFQFGNPGLSANGQMDTVYAEFRVCSACQPRKLVMCATFTVQRHKASDSRRHLLTLSVEDGNGSRSLLDPPGSLYKSSSIARVYRIFKRHLGFLVSGARSFDHSPFRSARHDIYFWECSSIDNQSPMTLSDRLGPRWTRKTLTGAQVMISSQ